MRCDEFQTQLQTFLDGDLPIHKEATLVEHSGRCPACGEIHEAAHRLTEGLRLQPMYFPPAGFADRVVSQALREAIPQRSSVRPWLALAAAVLFAGFALWTAGLWLGRPVDNSTSIAGTKPDPLAAIRTKLGEFVPVTIDATKQVVQETVNTATAMVPPVELSMPSLPVPMEVAWTPIREMGETVAVTIEPVAYSARQTWNAMWRGDARPNAE